MKRSYLHMAYKFVSFLHKPKDWEIMHDLLKVLKHLNLDANLSIGMSGYDKNLSDYTTFTWVLRK